MATRENKATQGIVYRLTPIKEKDAMVSCIGEEGLFSFFARGVMNPSSPDFAGTSLLSESSFVLAVSSQDALRLKESSLLRSYRGNEDYLSMMATQAILEVLCKVMAEDDAPSIYPIFKTCMGQIAGKGDPLTVLAIFLAKFLIVSGYGPTLDGCALCESKKDIVAFAPSQGGYLCRNCAEEVGEAKTSVDVLKAIRAVFLVPLESIGTFAFPPLTVFPLLSLLQAMVEEAVGVPLKGVASLLKYHDK